MGEETFSRTFRLPGLSATVLTNDAAFAAECGSVFFAPSAPGDEPEVVYNASVDRRFLPTRRHALSVGPDFLQIVMVTAFYPSLLPALEGDVLRRLLSRERGFHPLRGGCVAAGGRGILIAGDLDSGRGLLVRALVERGCEYLADALVPLTRAEHLALPFAKSIAVKRSHHPLASRARDGAPFRELDRTAIRYLPPPPLAASPRPVEILLFPRQDASAPPEVVPLGRADALIRLMANSYHTAETAAAAFATLSAVTAGARGFAVNLHGVTRTADLILEKAVQG